VVYRIKGFHAFKEAMKTVLPRAMYSTHRHFTTQFDDVWFARLSWVAWSADRQKALQNRQC